MFKSIVQIFLFACFLEIVMPITDEHKTQLQAKLEAAGEKCAKEKVTEDDIAALIDKKFPDEHETACLSACVLKNIGLVDEEGQLSHDLAVENAKTVFGDGDEIKALEEFIELCKESVAEGTDVCERAKLVFKCFGDHSEKFDL